MKAAQDRSEGNDSLVPLISDLSIFAAMIDPGTNPDVVGPEHVDYEGSHPVFG